MTPIAGFRTRLADSTEQETVLAVRKEAYQGLADKADLERLLVDEADAMPNCRSYLLVAPGGEVAGTIRPCLSTADFAWPRLPMHRLYPREMEILEADREPMIQSSRFGVVPGFRNLGMFPTLSLVRAVCGVALAFGIDRLVTLSSARPTKIGFWSRLGWRLGGQPIEYPFDRDGAVLMVGSISETLRIARETEKLQVLAAFPTSEKSGRCFPEEI